ncbi:MAG: sensor histidine kinase [Flavisolibacter sp.]
MSRFLLRYATIGFTMVLLLLFALYQHNSYQDSYRLTQRVLSLRSLRGRLIYYNEATGMSARLFVLTRDFQWKSRYWKFDENRDSAIDEVNKTVLNENEGKHELLTAAAALEALSVQAFALVQEKKYGAAIAIFSGKEYEKQTHLYNLGLAKLKGKIDGEIDNLVTSSHRMALHSIYFVAIVVILILCGWYFFYQISRKWQNILNESRQKRAAEVLASNKVLERTNMQLQLLSAHLQEVREKEKIAISFEIHEQTCQEITAIKNKLGLMEQALPGRSQSDMIDDIKAIKLQLRGILHSLTKLSGNVYPNILMDLGLVEALEQESRKMAEQSKMNIFFISEVESVELDQKRGTTLFRIFQEKLNTLVINGATEIVSVLSVENEHLHLSIEENSKVFLSNNHQLMEDIAIEARLASIKGRMETTPTEEGNRFSISIPYQASPMVLIKSLEEG